MARRLLEQGDHQQHHPDLSGSFARPFEPADADTGEVAAPEPLLS
jgi:hypothetical protein